jgi:hypothetical protein
MIEQKKKSLKYVYSLFKWNIWLCNQEIRTTTKRTEKFLPSWSQMVKVYNLDAKDLSKWHNMVTVELSIMTHV